LKPQWLVGALVAVCACRTDRRESATPSLPSARPQASPVVASVGVHDRSLGHDGSLQPGDALALEKRHIRRSRPARQPQPGIDQQTCAIDAEHPVVTSGLDAKTRERINEQLRPKEAVLEAECDFATSYEVRYHVVLNERGLLSVVFDGNWCCGAHPTYSKRFVNLRVRNGRAFTLPELFPARALPEIRSRLRAQVRKQLEAAGDTDVSDEWIEELVQQLRDFSFERGGVRFSLFDFAPHVIKALFESGFFFSCKELESLGLNPEVRPSICP
jgi:hypothetical protein